QFGRAISVPERNGERGGGAGRRPGEVGRERRVARSAGVETQLRARVQDPDPAPGRVGWRDPAYDFVASVGRGERVGTVGLDEVVVVRGVEVEDRPTEGAGTERPAALTDGRAFGPLPDHEHEAVGR